MLQKVIKNSVKLRTVNIYLAVALLLFAGIFSIVPKVSAATAMSHATLLESNMNSSGSSLLYVDFTTGATDTSDLVITYPSGFTIHSGAITTASSTCTSLFAGAAVVPGSLSASGSGQAITVSGVTSMTASTQYCLDFTTAGTVTNNATPGNYTVSIADGTDSTSVGIDVISDDQIAVDATVPPIFTLAFGANVDHLGTLSTSSLSTSSGVSLTVTTNAANGWGLWAEDSSAGLHSTAASHTIASLSAGSNHTMNGGTIGTEAYALGVTTANATTAYADAGGITGGGLSSTAFNEIASAGAPTAGSTVTVKELADMSGVTPAAPDYADTVTIIGAGSF